MMRSWTLSVLAVFVCLARVETISVVPMTFEELTAEATAVVYARVAEVHGQWAADRRSIDSLITLEALRYLKGDLGSMVTMRLPGGRAGGVVHVLPGAPVLRDGDVLIVFLSTRGPTIPTALGLSQGIFPVIRDPRSGALLVAPPPLKASAAGNVIRGAADRRLLTVEAFAESVRALEAAR